MGAGVAVEGVANAWRHSVGKGEVLLYRASPLTGSDDTLDTDFRRLLLALCRRAAPVQVTGDVQRAFAQTTKGWDVLLMNNRGVFKFHDQPAEVDPTREATVTVTLDRMPRRVVAWRDGRMHALTPLDLELAVAVPPGGVTVLRIES